MTSSSVPQAIKFFPSLAQTLFQFNSILTICLLCAKLFSRCLVFLTHLILWSTIKYYQTKNILNNVQMSLGSKNVLSTLLLKAQERAKSSSENEKYT